MQYSWAVFYGFDGRAVDSTTASNIPSYMLSTMNYTKVDLTKGDDNTYTAFPTIDVNQNIAD